MWLYCQNFYYMEKGKMEKGYIKCGNIIVTMTGDVCCTVSAK